MPLRNLNRSPLRPVQSQEPLGIVQPGVRHTQKTNWTAVVFRFQLIITIRSELKHLYPLFWMTQAASVCNMLAGKVRSRASRDLGFPWSAPSVRRMEEQLNFGARKRLA